MANEPTPEQIAANRKLFAGCMTPVVIVAAFVGWSLLTGGDGDADETDEYGAQVMCENFVEDRLKSPGSADFGGWVHSVVDSNTWEVSGHVDSDNSFGASIRNEFTCTMSYQGDDVWHLDDMAITGN